MACQEMVCSGSVWHLEHDIAEAAVTSAWSRGTKQTTATQMLPAHLPRRCRSHARPWPRARARPLLCPALPAA